MNERIICGDCAIELQKIPDKSIDLTVTSPPYADLRDYDGYSFDFKTIVSELLRVTKNGGIVVWIINDSVIDGSETLTSFKQALEFKECGFRVHDTMIYAKKSCRLPDPTRYHQAFEYMFVFSKGKPKTFNPINDRKNKYGGARKKHYIREKDGIIYGRNNDLEIVENGRRYNVWTYNTGFMLSTIDKIAFEHPAIFPEKLAYDHIISWSNEGDLILDPMMGSGTTWKMAKALKRNFIGIEISPRYIEIAKKRCANIQEVLIPTVEMKRDDPHV